MRTILQSCAAVAALVAALGCEDKPAVPPPAPVAPPEAVAPKAEPAPAPAPAPVAAPAPAPTAAADAPHACSWADIREGERVTYSLTREPMSGGKAIRQGGNIVGETKTAAGSFDLHVVARSNDKAWAEVAFDGVSNLPSGLPAKFLLELHTGASATAATMPWLLPSDAARPSQLTVNAKTFTCTDHVVAPPNPQHVCVVEPADCLYWLDGLARSYHYVGKDERESIELTAWSPAAKASTAAPPAADGGNHFSGSWYVRTDPLTVHRVRFWVENGQLVRELQPFKMVTTGADLHNVELLKAEAGTYAANGPPTRESTSFRGWVLDILSGKPIDAKWIPATSEHNLAFLSFP
ncbi:MAG: hypothetical protein JST54_09410 [Deltaproteobacteria bacterium]|nr:hypothetical protein [Deltaproteobacteria bacterium]